METKTYKAYVEILKAELIPALGCTEPIAIAYGAAKMAETLGEFPDNIIINCSGNIIKNVMGVIVPNSGGHKGIATAAVLGVISGESSKELEVLNNITKEQQERAQELIKNNFCSYNLAKHVENLYIHIVGIKGENSASVTIIDNHTNITNITKNDTVIYSLNDAENENSLLSEYKNLLNLKDIIEFAKTVSIDHVGDVIESQIKYNSAIAKAGLTERWGAQVGRTLLSCYDGNDIKIKAKAYAAAGSDARMNGCSLPVVINSGSGNQGITVSLPVIAYANELNKSNDQLIRALVVSNLVSLLQKKYIGSLSAYCGAVSAAAGAGAGIAFLNDSSIDVISKTITNTIANVGGIICDGAKSSCASKIASSVDAAILGFTMASNFGNSFSAGDGLVKSDIDKTIQSFGRLAKDGMKTTDIEIINIMLDN